jgi:glycerate dehydrogenase
MDQAARLKLICIAATGMNNVDLDYAMNKNIPVKNVSGYSTDSVTQSTFAMLFYLMNHLQYYDEYVKSGSYTQSPIFTHHGREFYELKNKTFGIIGLGTIGKTVAKIASSFSCRVVYYSTSGNNRNADYERVSLETLLKSSDLISIHAPLNENTENLIGLKELTMMKRTAILINAGRGGIVSEKDLAAALDEDLIYGAGLDVLEKEPIDKGNPLLSIKNREKLLITPHIAWASLESRTLLMDKVYDNIKDYLDNRTDQ